MATKNDLFNKLVEVGILTEDADINSYTKKELSEMIDEPDSIEDDDFNSYTKKELSEMIDEPEMIDALDVAVISKFEISSDFKPLYRINPFKKDSLPVIKISPGVFKFIEAQIHLDDIQDTPVERQLTSLVYHIRKQRSKFITVSPAPNKQYRIFVVNDVLMIKTW